MAINHSKVLLISESFVKPKYEVEESKKPHHLTGEDLTLLSFPYTQKGFLYKKPCDFNMTSFVEKMKHSLSHVLVYYYPLAGQFTTVKYENEHACSIYIDCNKGPGARLIHASAVDTDVSMSDIVSRTFSELPLMKHFFSLGEEKIYGYDGHTRPLVIIQVTELVDGVFIGTSTNHSPVDGASFLHFFGSLSEIFMKYESNTDALINITHVPIFKPFLPEGCNLIQKLPYLECDEFITRTRADIEPEIKEKIFNFSPSSMKKLKSKANSECGTGDKISSFQALAALVWISINRARKVPVQETTTCIIPIDCRPRFKPALSSDHFGNYAQSLRVTKTVGELLKNGLGSASMVLNQGISAYDEQCVTKYLKGVMDNPSVMRLDDIKKWDKFNVVNFAGGARFDMHGFDFGLGKAVAARTGDIARRVGQATVKVGREGTGSVELAVFLLHDGMLALQSDKDFMAYVS